MMPKRIQRKRAKDWRMPGGAVYVGRPTKWGNPFKVGHRYQEGDSFLRHYGHLLDGGLVTAENCLTAFEAYCQRVAAHGGDWLKPLRGKDLACWCKDGAPCHADVLLRLANEPFPRPVPEVAAP